jgi:hypothetical protein
MKKQNLIKKSGIAMLAGAMMFSAVLPTKASAATVSELQAMIAQLQSQIAALSGGSATPAFTYTRDLTLGSTGADVVVLQTFLEAKGHLTMPAGVSKGNFGPLTRAALVQYQLANGISPAAGYFGPMTRARVQSQTVSTSNPTTPSNPGNLSGEGDIVFDVLTDGDINIDLGKKDTAIEVELEAQDGDVRIDRLDFYFNKRPWLYFAEVNLLADGKEVASLTRSGDFTQTNNEYRARFSNLNKMVKEDDAITYSLELVVLNSMQGTRDTETIVVEMDNSSVRFVDASGAVMTTGENITAEVSFDDTFGQGDISLSIGDNSPEKATIVLNENSRTNNISVLEFDVEADESDLEVQDIEVTFATVGTGVSSVSDTLYRAHLYKGSTLLKSKAVTANTVVFDDIAYTIDEDDTETFTVKVDFNQVDGLTIDTLQVVNVKVVAEDEDFQDVEDTLTVNESHQLVVEGLVDEFISKSTRTTNLGTTQTNAIFTFEFELTAYEDDFFIAEDGSDFVITLDNASTTVVATTIASTNATLTSDDSYRINKGQTRTFKVEVEVASVSGSQSARMAINSLEYFTESNLSGTSAIILLGAPDYRSTAVTVFKQI